MTQKMTHEERTIGYMIVWCLADMDIVSREMIRRLSMVFCDGKQKVDSENVARFVESKIQHLI